MLEGADAANTAVLEVLADRGEVLVSELVLVVDVLKTRGRADGEAAGAIR